jgi:hypothetical protein
MWFVTAVMIFLQGKFFNYYPWQFCRKSFTTFSWQCLQHQQVSPQDRRKSGGADLVTERSLQQRPEKPRCPPTHVALKIFSTIFLPLERNRCVEQVWLPVGKFRTRVWCCSYHLDHLIFFFIHTEVIYPCLGRYALAMFNNLAGIEPINFCTWGGRVAAMAFVALYG